MEGKKKKISRSKVNKKAWEFRRKFSLTWKVALRYAWSYFKENYPPYFEIEFEKKDKSKTKRIGSNLELKKQGLIFYSISDSQYKTANPEKVISIIAKNLEVKVNEK